MKYNIHNILKIDSDLEIFPKYFEGNFENADLVIRKGDIKIDKKKYKRFSLKFWGKKNELYFESYFYGFPLNKILIKNLKELYYLKNSNRYNIVGIARFLFEINLLKKGCTLVHAGAVEKDNKGYLIVALAEGGKSTATLNLGLSGGKILGDDMVIISEKGQIYSLIDEIRIYSGSEILNKLNLSKKKKLESKIRYLASKISPLHWVIDANLTLDSKYFKMAKQAKINDIIILPENEKRDKETLVNILLASTLSLFNEKFPNRIFQAYCLINGIDPTFFVRQIKEVISRAVNSIK